MTETQQEFFRNVAEALGFRVEIHTDPDHWHLTK